MADLIMVTGGCRSGKSTYARKLAEALPGPRIFLATSPVLDAEMAERIDIHRRERMGAEWITIEETLRLESALSKADAPGVILLDCLSLWVNNLMHAAGQDGTRLGESDIAAHCRALLAAAAGKAYTLVVVTNEVGLGIVPDNALARQYRDLLGRANQILAAAARQVTFMVSGIPLHIKE